MNDQERHESIAQIEQTMRNLGLLDFAGEVQLLEWAKSTSRDGPKVKLLLPDDESVAPFESATIRKGKQAGQIYYVLAVRIDEPVLGGAGATHPSPGGEGGAALVESPGAATCPKCGEPPAMHLGNACPPKNNEFARDLHRNGVFFNPKLWAACEAMDIYTRAQHNLWLRTQRCYGAKHAKHIDCLGEVCGHHTPSAALPAGGEGQKHPHKVPDWYQLPLCVAHHNHWAHGSGDMGATREEKLAMVDAGAKLTAEQIKEAIKRHLDVPTFRFITRERWEAFEKEVGLR